MKHIPFTPQKVSIYLNDEFQFIVNNDIELLLVQKQVLEEELEGVTAVWQGITLTINPKTGNLSGFPRGMYDQAGMILAEIFKIQQSKKSKN